jgi:drug/metabolite transporter (DMT)-like permease
VTGVQVGISKGNDGQITRVEVSITHQVPIIAWSLLATGTLVGALWTPMALLETGVSSPVKCVWKSIMEMVAFTPLFVYSVFTEGLDRPGGAKLLWMVSAGVTNGGSNLVLFWAIEHTSMTHAVLLSSTSAIVLAIGRPLLGLGYPKPLEAVGIIIAIIGGYICTRDDPQHHPGVLADSLCLFAAVLTALNLVCAKYLWDDFKLWQYCFWQQLGSLSLYLFFAAITRIATLDMDRQTGLFGCFNFTADRLLINFTGGPACALFGTAALIATLKYLDPVLISVAAILQPLLSTLFGFILGATSFPKPIALLGGMVMSAGTGLVVHATGGEETEVIDVPIKDDRVDKSNISSENKAPSASWRSLFAWKKGVRVMAVFGKEPEASGEHASLLSTKVI